MSDPRQPDRQTYSRAEAAAKGEDDIVQNEQIVNQDDAEDAAEDGSNE